MLIQFLSLSSTSMLLWCEPARLLWGSLPLGPCSDPRRVVPPRYFAKVAAGVAPGVAAGAATGIAAGGAPTFAIAPQRDKFALVHPSGKFIDGSHFDSQSLQFSLQLTI